MFYWKQNQSSTSELKHPTTMWSKRSWKDWVFRWWDRENQKEVEIKLPEEFIVVAEGMWVDGYIDSPIGSNEFFNAKDDIVKVRDYKSKNAMFIWTWGTIKDKVKATGLPLWKHLHIIDPNAKETKIITLKIKWTAWVSWSDFNTLNQFAPRNNRIKITGTVKGKKWATTFVTPKFELWAPLSEDDKVLQEGASKQIEDYYLATKVTKEEVKQENKKYDDVDQLPF